MFSSAIGEYQVAEYKSTMRWVCKCTHAATRCHEGRLRSGAQLAWPSQPAHSASNAQAHGYSTGMQSVVCSHPLGEILHHAQMAVQLAVLAARLACAAGGMSEGREGKIYTY